MRVGPMTPTLPPRLPSRYDAVTRLKGFRSGSECSAPMMTARPGRVEVLGQQPHEPLLLLDHLDQRAQRVERHLAVLLRASAMSDAVPSTKSACWPMRADRARSAICEGLRHQLVVEAARLVEPRHDRRAHFVDREARELTIHVVGRAPEVVGGERLAAVHDLLRHLAVLGDGHDEDAAPAERDELDLAEPLVLGDGRQREPHVMRFLRQHARRAGQQLFERGLRRWPPGGCCPRCGELPPDAGARAAGPRRSGSRDRSARGRRTCAAGGRSPAPRGGRGRCGWSRTTLRARHGEPRPPTPPALRSRCSGARPSRGCDPTEG